MLDCHPRSISDSDYVFLHARMKSSDLFQKHNELRDWVRANAGKVFINESKSGYPKVLNYILRTVVIFAAPSQSRRGNH
eukprot:12225034-Karenia_brevis.AAC.1